MVPIDPSLRPYAFVVGALLMLLGIYLQWRLPHERMTVEELAKERRLTEEQGRRRIRLIRWSSRLAVLLGIVAFVLSFAE